jgi:hypothetical protein
MHGRDEKKIPVCPVRENQRFPTACPRTVNQLPFNQLLLGVDIVFYILAFTLDL